VIAWRAPGAQQVLGQTHEPVHSLRAEPPRSAARP
jgi:hypothetical protein